MKIYNEDQLHSMMAFSRHIQQLDAMVFDKTISNEQAQESIKKYAIDFLNRIINSEIEKSKDTALTMMQLLVNAGASFEDQELALNIIAQTIYKSKAQ